MPPEKTQDLLSWMGATGCTCRFAAVSMYHVASKTLSIDHNFDMFQPGEDWDKQPPMVQGFHPRHTLQSGVHAGMHVVDPMVNIAQIKALLALDVRLIVDLHTEPTRIVWGYATQDAFVKHLTAVWTKSGELDETGKALPQN